MSSVEYISHGPAMLYIAATGTALPADTVGAGIAWGGSWTQIGWTESPVTLTYEYTPAEAMIQESLAPVARWKSAETLTWETTLAETNCANIQYAIEGTLATTAAAAGVHGYTNLKVGGADTLTVRAWGFEWNETISSVVQPIRVLVYRGTATAGTAFVGGKDKANLVTLKGAAVADMTGTQGERLFYIHHVTAESV